MLTLKQNVVSNVAIRPKQLRYTTEKRELSDDWNRFLYFVENKQCENIQLSEKTGLI